MKSRPRAPKDGVGDAVAKVRAVYADLEARPIERACTGVAECCQFQLTGLTPQLTKGEALVAARAVRASGRKELPVSREGACPMLHPGTARCLIYRDRPFGCRTHFCRNAGGPYTRAEVLDLIRRLEDVDRELGGDGPHAIQAALRQALRELSER